MDNTLTLKSRLIWRDLLITSCVGMLFLLINFPKSITKIILTTITDPGWKMLILYPVTGIQSALTSLIGYYPANVFYNVMSVNFILLFFFIFILIIFSIRHMDFLLFGLCVIGFIFGYYTLNLLSWIAILLITVMSYFGIFLQFIGYIINLIINYIFFKGWWVLLILAIAYMIYIFKNKLLSIIVASLVIAIVGFYVVHLFRWILKIIEPVINFIKMILISYIQPAIIFFVRMLIILLFMVGGLLILNAFGRLVVDQLRCAWNSSRGRKQLALCGFAIGIALALIVMTSVASPRLAKGINMGWKHSLDILDTLTHTSVLTGALSGIQPSNLLLNAMPNPVKIFIFQNLTNAPTPIFDSFIFLTIITIANISMITKLIKPISKDPATLGLFFLPKEVGAILGGLLMSVAVIFLQAGGEGD